MNRRFRPFYVAAIAVVMVGLYGTETVPRSHKQAAPESVAVESTMVPDDVSEWLGPLETPATGLLHLNNSLSILPFDVAR